MQMIPSHKIIADDAVKKFMSNIDKEGHVSMFDDEDDYDYEEEPLKIRVKSATYNRILSGEKKSHKILIKDEKCARELFAHDKNGKVLVNKIWADKKIKNYWDMNDGHFPFIFRKYQSVLFINKDNGEMVEVEVDGSFDADQGIDAEDYYNWKAIFKLGKILKRKKREPFDPNKVYKVKIVDR